MKKITFPQPIRVKCIHGNKRSFPVEGKVYEAVATDVRGQLYFENEFPNHKRMEFFEVAGAPTVATKAATASGGKGA